MRLLKFFGMVSLGNKILWYEMDKVYQEYRDFARQELNDGYERHPIISGLAEVGGAAISPVKIHTPRGYIGSLGSRVSAPADIAKSRWINSIGTGVINGAGYTNENNPYEYGKNIGMSAITNTSGTAVGNKLFGKGNEMYRFGRTMMNIGAQSFPYGYKYFRNAEEDE